MPAYGFDPRGFDAIVARLGASWSILRRDTHALPERSTGEIAVDDANPIRGEAYVLWAYRVLLGREPESWAAVRNNTTKHDRRALVHDILTSQEFADVNGFAPFLTPEAAAAAQADELALLRAYRRLDPAGRAQLLALAERLDPASADRAGS
jgi:hypothetical protein